MVMILGPRGVFVPTRGCWLGTPTRDCRGPAVESISLALRERRLRSGGRVRDVRPKLTPETRGPERPLRMEPGETRRICTEVGCSKVALRWMRTRRGAAAADTATMMVVRSGGWFAVKITSSVPMRDCQAGLGDGLISHPHPHPRLRLSANSSFGISTRTNAHRLRTVGMRLQGKQRPRNIQVDQMKCYVVVLYLLQLSFWRRSKSAKMDICSKNRFVVPCSAMLCHSKLLYMPYVLSCSRNRHRGR